MMSHQFVHLKKLSLLLPADRPRDFCHKVSSLRRQLPHLKQDSETPHVTSEKKLRLPAPLSMGHLETQKQIELSATFAPPVQNMEGENAHLGQSSHKQNINIIGGAGINQYLAQFVTRILNL